MNIPSLINNLDSNCKLCSHACQSLDNFASSWEKLLIEGRKCKWKKERERYCLHLFAIILNNKCSRTKSKCFGRPTWKMHLTCFETLKKSLFVLGNLADGKSWGRGPQHTRQPRGPGNIPLTWPTRGTQTRGVLETSL